MRLIVLGSVLLLACVSDNPGGDAGPAQGALGGKCFSNGTCNAGLVCVVPDTCVLPDAGATDATSDAIADVATDTTTTDSGVDAGPCPTTALVAFWKGENSAADEEAYLSLQELGSTYVAGHTGTAFSFSGTSYLQAAAGAHATLPAITTTLTIEAWIDPTSITSGTILSRRSDQGSGYELRIEQGKVVFQTASFTVTGSATLAASIPHHVAVSVGTTSMQLYLDGVADGSAFPVSNPIQSDAAVVKVASGWGPAQVTKNLFTGWIDELAVYANALSATEIAALAAGGQKCH